MTLARRGILAFGTAIVLLLLLREVAQAHAMLVSAEPAANSLLAASPTRVRLVFSEELDPSLAHLSVVSSDGSTRTLAVHGDPRDVRALIAPVDSLPNGAYRLRWRVVSADGHPVEGSYAFSIGGAVIPEATPDTTTVSEAATWGPVSLGAPIVPAMLRGLAVGSFMVLAGLIAFALLSPASGIDGDASARWRRATTRLATVATILLGSYFAAWIVNASPSHQLGGDETGAVLRSGVARVEEWRFGLGVLALWAAVIARRLRLALVFAAAAVAIGGATGHSAAINPIVAIPSRSVHLLAGAAWLGGVLWLVLIRDADAAVFRDEAMRVSRVALWSATLVGLSGAAQAFVFLPSLGALFTSSYGAVTLAKLAGLCVLVGFGAYHRSRSLPRMAAEPRAMSGFARVLRAELVVMAVVVLLGGWLAYISPPPSPAHSAAHTHS